MKKILKYSRKIDRLILMLRLIFNKFNNWLQEINLFKK